MDLRVNLKVLPLLVDNAENTAAVLSTVYSTDMCVFLLVSKSYQHILRI